MFDKPIKKPAILDAVSTMTQATALVERNAHVVREQAHFVTSLFEKGIVGGLIVSADTTPSRVVVGRGAAVDGTGRLIVLAAQGHAQVGGSTVVLDVPANGFLVPVGANFAHVLVVSATEIPVANLLESASLVSGVDLQPTLELKPANGYVDTPNEVVLAYVSSNAASIATVATAAPGRTLARVEAALLGGGLQLRECNTTTAGPGLHAASGGIVFTKSGGTPTATISSGGGVSATSAALTGALSAGSATINGPTQVNGDLAIQGKHALRGNDSWLRLNQDRAFSAGVHTPGVFAPGSLNVGGVGNWGQVPNGNIALTGDIAMEGGHTLASKGRLHISGEELLFLLNKQGVVIGKHWGGNGDLTVDGNMAVGGGVAMQPNQTLSGAGRLHITGTELLYLLNKDGVVIGKEWGGNGNLSVQGEVAVGGSFVEIEGAGGEKVYLGGDGAGNDAQIGSANAGVMKLGVWNRATGGWMDVRARNFATSSDARLKEDVESVGDALQRVLALRPVTFRWKARRFDTTAATSAAETIPSEPSPREVGLLAQQVAEVLPEAVSEDGRGHLCVSYNAITTLLLRAVQEQQATIDALRDEVRQIRAKS